jgi:hypothetical protein
MQKVEGSSPFSRFERPANAGLFCARHVAEPNRAASVGSYSHPSRPMTGTMLRSRSSIQGPDRRALWPVLCALVALLGVAPVGVALSDDAGSPAPRMTASLAEVARRGGCELSEFETDPRSNPPVSGRVDERVFARDGSYVGRRAPSELAATHALLHGRVVVQYRPGLADGQIARLERHVRRDPAGVLLFENRTGMRQAVAATAYLTLMTCPRVDARALDALLAFRARRSNFGQGF